MNTYEQREKKKKKKTGYTAQLWGASCNILSVLARVISTLCCVIFTNTYEHQKRQQKKITCKDTAPCRKGMHNSAIWLVDVKLLESIHTMSCAIVVVIAIKAYTINKDSILMTLLLR